MSVRRRFAEKLADPELRRKMGHSMGSSLAHRQERMAEAPEWEELRDAAQAIRAYGVAHLDELLAQLEANLQRRGVKVYWAADARAANDIIIGIVKAKGAQRLVKGKTMTSEETGLNEALVAAGLQPVETDLGEYLIQLAGDKPTHITAPAVHLSRQDCGRLISEALDIPYTDDPQTLTLRVREALRPEFLRAQVGLSGANFAVAETGTLVICDNEGNQGLVTALPDTHIALVGLEKIVPRLADLGPLLRLLARNSTGQTLTGYTTLITGPRREHDADGPTELHVVLLDNGRTAMLREPAGRSALMCIRCGVCCNICPIYSKVGGHAYGLPYPGAVGTLWGPYLGEEWSRELASVCSLCGACAEACPVKNPISHRLVALRQDRRARARRPLSERLGVKGLARVLAHPLAYRLAGRLLRLGYPLRGLAAKFAPPLAGWLSSRELPPVPPRSYLTSRLEEKRP